MSDHLRERFIQYITNHHLIRKGEKVLLAVSGGADSMLMCHLFLKTGFDIGLAHCNFQLRGKEADEDENFVKKFAEHHHLSFHHIHFETRKYAEEEQVSVEVAARELRYQWFNKISAARGYSLLATAHHKNDNAETLLFNLFRGTGIHGLHGIAPKRKNIIRPLLFLTKKEILHYMKEHHLPFKVDRSNSYSIYTRNYIRNEVIPLIERKFPSLVSNINANIQRFSEAETIYNRAITEEKKQLLTLKGKEVFIPIQKLLKKKPLHTIAFEIFKNYGFSYEQIKQILQLTGQSSGKVVYSSTHQLLKDRKHFIISPFNDEKKKYFIIEEKDKNIQNQFFSLKIRTQKPPPYLLKEEQNIAALDKAKLTFPLVLRRWRQGDYFYPLGMRKKKKLSRFFIDQKLSLNQKKKVWILTSGSRIIWIVGMRIDDRFKITNKTKEVIEMTYLPKKEEESP